jgi:beta-aspartyl-peptidase (threonine type)
MDGAELAAGAVGAVSTVVNPVRLARAVLADARHVLLVGAGAERFAREQGLPTAPPSSFITARRRTEILQPPAGGNTVGAVAVDRLGHVAAATSTGGLAGKRPGRIGDSAVIGAGTYADDRAGAASATGHGEVIVLAGLARSAVDRLRDGTTPQTVAPAVIQALTLGWRADAGIVLVDRFGRLAFARNTERMLVGYQTADDPAPRIAD